jgi:hypothetical protein
MNLFLYVLLTMLDFRTEHRQTDREAGWPVWMPLSKSMSPELAGYSSVCA